MKPFHQLIKSKTYHLTKFQNKLYGEVDDYLKKNDLSKKDFAKQLNVSKGYVSQVLNGGFDHKLSKMFELSIAINKIPNIELLDVKEYKRMKLRERIENLPLDLVELQEMHGEEENHMKDFANKGIHAEKSLIELSFV